MLIFRTLSYIHFRMKISNKVHKGKQSFDNHKKRKTESLGGFIPIYMMFLFWTQLFSNHPAYTVNTISIVITNIPTVNIYIYNKKNQFNKTFIRRSISLKFN